jgi:hypothetical protein
MLTSIAIATYLVTSSMRASANNEKKILASMVAESAMEEIRAAANDSYGNLADLYEGKTWTYPAYADFSVVSKVAWERVYVPCSSLESQYPATSVFPEPGQATFDQSLWKVQVTVSWSPSPFDRVRLVSHVADWRPVGALTVEISPSGGELARDGVMTFTGVARNNGVEVPDLVLSWYTEPLDGYGTVVNVSRDGANCQYKNVYRNYDGSYTHAPGLCDLVVRANYQGRQAETRVRINNLP